MNGHCNLLPAAVRRGRILRGRLERWSLALLAVVLGVGVLAGCYYRQHASARARLDSIRTESDELQRLVADTYTSRKRLVEVRAQLARRERIVPPEDTMEVFDLIGRGHETTAGRLSVGNLHLERRRVEVPAEKPNAKPTHREVTRIEVTGVALDDDVIARFVAELRRSAPSGRVELQSGSTVDVEGHRVRRYTVVCAFE